MERNEYPFSPYSCDNIYFVVNDITKLRRMRQEYEELFGDAEWWDQRGDGLCGSPVRKSFRDQRILALCFMAAITE